MRRANVLHAVFREARPKKGPVGIAHTKRSLVAHLITEFNGCVRGLLGGVELGRVDHDNER